MHKLSLAVSHARVEADMLTPLRIFSALRTQFPESVLLEGGDNRGGEFGKTYILASAIASLELTEAVSETTNPTIWISTPRGVKNHEVTSPEVLPAVLAEFIQSFEVPSEFKNILGVVGHTTYDCVPYFEDIRFEKKAANYAIPGLHYALYEYFLVFDHKAQMLNLYYSTLGETASKTSSKEAMDKVIALIQNFTESKQEHFALVGAERSLTEDERFRDNINLCKKHIQRGDVFQIVPSRCFAQKFSGDELDLYRALRVINPSPFLFFFDKPNYKIFGSSPEAQIVMKERKASIFPIAGTYKRSGDDAVDERQVRELLADGKENSEHVMLVDLARNDLSKHCDSVEVKAFREVHFYSHVIHLVSHVQGAMRGETETFKLFADTFPAGTLTGAPKYKAMELINSFEKHPRHMYGGAVGLFTFGGDCIHAICIRTFVSQNNEVFYQAGCGVVADSDTEKEVEEVASKLRALRVALSLASRQGGNNE